MHPSISKTLKAMGTAVLALLLVALLPLGTVKLPALGFAILGLGFGCALLVAFGCLHGQVPSLFPPDILYSKHDKFFFSFYLIFYVLAGAVCLVAGIVGLLAQA